MIGDIYVLDKDLNAIGLVDTYKSCIWSNRYKELGDCELYIEATAGMLDILKDDYYLARLDDDMVCQIKHIELDTDAENGNYLVVTAYDAKRFLDQRVIWGTANCKGSVEAFIRSMVDKALISTDISERKLTKPGGGALLQLGSTAGFTETATEQMSYQNIGNKVRDYCTRYGWGYRFVKDGSCFRFELYKGADRSAMVVFSDDYENLDTTTYTKDSTHLGNIALVAGEGEGAERTRAVSGTAEGMDRYEVYVDAKDLSKTITWADLTEMYPTVGSGGQGYISTEGGAWVYMMGYVDIQVIDQAQLAALAEDYPDGQEITIDGTDYYRIPDVAIADLTSDDPSETEAVVLRDVIYTVYLLSRGYDRLAEYGVATSFEGTVQPDVTFTYKKDYFLGDLVTVKNSFGIQVSARIVEVTEVRDDNGYRMEPKFEYLGVDNG